MTPNEGDLRQVLCNSDVDLIIGLVLLHAQNNNILAYNYTTGEIVVRRALLLLSHMEGNCLLFCVAGLSSSHAYRMLQTLCLQLNRYLATLPSFLAVRKMDLEYRILNLYKSRQYDKCLQLCSEFLHDRQDRMIEFIQMRALTVQAKVAGLGYEEVDYGLPQDDLASTAVAKTPRPGTTFHTNSTRNVQTTAPLRATTSTATRSRAGTGAGRARTARSALQSAARASRAATALVGVSAPFTPGAPLTLTLLTKEDKNFVGSAKTFYEYVFYCEGDVRKAMEIAAQAQKAETSSDWWWNFSLAKCYNALRMHRNAEDCLRQALKQNKHIGIYLRLAAMYVALNQPLAALEICKHGLAIFPEDTSLTLEKARILDEMGNTQLAVNEYRNVAVHDATNVEAVASIAMYNFYNDQPEIAMRYYRRLLATCEPGAELYNNMGLCCLYCSQWDLALPCFRQALYYATSPETRADIWFNLAHVALVCQDRLTSLYNGVLVPMDMYDSESQKKVKVQIN